jgi:hypothetical protein
VIGVIRHGGLTSLRERGWRLGAWIGHSDRGDVAGAPARKIQAFGLGGEVPLTSLSDPAGLLGASISLRQDGSDGRDEAPAEKFYDCSLPLGLLLTLIARG